MQVGRHRAAGAGLLADQAEVADLHGLCRIAQVEHLGHAPRAPAVDAGNEIGDAGVALPEALVRVLQIPARLGDQHRLRRIGDVPDLVAGAAERAQQIDRVAVALRQGAAVADARHLRAAGLEIPLLARDVEQVFRLRRIGDVDDRGAVELGLSGERIERLRHLRRAAVMADIGDVAVALLMNGRLIGAARLQVVHADEAHVLGFGRIADLGRGAGRLRHRPVRRALQRWRGRT